MVGILVSLTATRINHSWFLAGLTTTQTMPLRRIVFVVQGQLVENPLKDTRIGRKKKEAIKLLAEDDIIETVNKRASDLVKHLVARLEDKVYREKDIKTIRNTCVLLSTRN